MRVAQRRRGSAAKTEESGADALAAFFDAGMGRSLLVLVYINLNMGSTLLSAGLDPLDKQEDTGYREIPAPDTSNMGHTSSLDYYTKLPGKSGITHPPPGPARGRGGRTAIML